MKLQRTIVLTLVMLATVRAMPAVRAQEGRKIPLMGYLHLVGPNPLAQAFLDGLRDLGYVEGQNIRIEVRAAEGKAERLPALAAELVALQPDVIVTSTIQPSRAAQAVTATVPIVFVATSDPVGPRLVTSLARPGGSVTGFTTAVPEGYAGKQLEFLRELVPHTRRLAVLRNPTNVSTDLQRSAGAAGIELSFVEFRSADEIEPAGAAAGAAHVDALIVLGDPLTYNHRGRVVALAAAHRLPAIHMFRDAVEQGGLASWGPDFPDLYRRAAGYVDKILIGAKPGDLPVEQPVRFELVINANVARNLGLEIPSSLLARADEVIE